MVAHGEMSQGLVIVNSLCNYTVREFSEAAAVNRGDSDTHVDDPRKKQISFLPAIAFMENV